jgi:hypothetical protein
VYLFLSVANPAPCGFAAFPPRAHRHVREETRFPAAGYGTAVVRPRSVDRQQRQSLGSAFGPATTPLPPNSRCLSGPRPFGLDGGCARSSAPNETNWPLGTLLAGYRRAAFLAHLSGSAIARTCSNAAAYITDRSPQSGACRNGGRILLGIDR